MKLRRRQGDHLNLEFGRALLRRFGWSLPEGNKIASSAFAPRHVLPLASYSFLLLFCVAVIAGVFVIGVYESRERMLSQTEIQLRQKTALLEAYVGKILDANDMVLSNIKSEIEMMTWDEIFASARISRLLAVQQGYLKHSGVIALVDGNGEFLSNSEGSPARSFNVADRDYFRFLRSHPSDTTFIGEPVIGRLYGKPSLTMSRALRRADGSFDGLILITMPIEYFSAVFEGAASRTDLAQLLRENGEVVANVPFWEGSGAAPGWFPGAIASDGTNGTIRHVMSSEGIERIITYRKVRDFPFYVTYGIDENALLNGWRRSVWVYGMVLAAAIGAFMATAWLARRRSIDLLQSNISLREVSDTLLVSQDEERRVIARDLHDSTGQHLIGVSMALESMRSDLPDMSHSIRAKLDRAVELITVTNEELRTLSYVLHPPMLDESGLPNALELLVEGFEDRSGLEIELRVDPELGNRRPPPGVELALFRIVQEALTNIYRHSKAQKTLIRLVRQGTSTAPMLSLTVNDNGLGIERRNRKKVGVGLSGMHSRLRPIGGTLHISTGKTGTTISVKVPG